MADRVTVLSDGKLRKVGTPSELYRTPQTAQVAGFIGETNFLPAEVIETTADALQIRLGRLGRITALTIITCSSAFGRNMSDLSEARRAFPRLSSKPPTEEVRSEGKPLEVSRVP